MYQSLHARQDIRLHPRTEDGWRIAAASAARGNSTRWSLKAEKNFASPLPIATR